MIGIIYNNIFSNNFKENFFKSLNLQPWQFLVITQLIIFLLGWPLEWTEILIIFVPIFLPLVEFFGVNPYFFAMLIAQFLSCLKLRDTTESFTAIFAG